jgi:hypothetical protein
MHPGDTPTRFDELAPTLVANGYAVVPAAPASKRPLIRNWTRFSRLVPDQRQIVRWSALYPSAGVFGVLSATLLAFDNDLHDAADNAWVHDICCEVLGRDGLVRIGQWPRRLLLYRSSTAFKTRRLPGFEVRSMGAGVMLYGVHPLTNAPYRYDGLSPFEVPAIDLAVVTTDAVEELIRQVSKHLGVAATQPGASTPKSTTGWSTPVTLMEDGRERFVADKIWHHYLSGWRNADAITQQVLKALQEAANLSRPHASGRPYDYAFIHERVAATLKRAKPVFFQGPRPAAHAQALDPSTRTAFRDAVNAAGAVGDLRRSSVLVSHAMLASIGIANSAYCATSTLALRTGLSVETVKRARRELRDKGYWRAVDDVGGRARIAHYLPIIDRGHPDD